MNIKSLSNGLVATLILVSPLVGAEEYPAADFKPKVVYQDLDKSPAQSSSTKSAASAEVDANYPAANFEPKVLYKDDNYKPSKFTASSSSSSSSNVSSAADEVTVSGSVKAKEDSMMTYLLGFIVFAVVGYIFLSKRETKSTAYETKTYTQHASGLSGVSRYVRKHNLEAATGVARYLESKVTTAKEIAAASGVEKYLEKQAQAAKEKAAQASTGVERYMRNRG